MQPRIRGTNLVNKYRLLKGYWVIQNKAAYMYDDRSRALQARDQSSSRYADLFVITQYPFDNPYLVTKLVPLILGCTDVSFDRNINGLFTPDALPVQRIVIEKLDSLQYFSRQVLFAFNNRAG